MAAEVGTALKGLLAPLRRVVSWRLQFVSALLLLIAPHVAVAAPCLTDKPPNEQPASSQSVPPEFCIAGAVGQHYYLWTIPASFTGKNWTLKLQALPGETARLLVQSLDHDPHAGFFTPTTIWSGASAGANATIGTPVLALKPGLYGIVVATQQPPGLFRLVVASTTAPASAGLQAAAAGPTAALAEPKTTAAEMTPSPPASIPTHNGVATQAQTSPANGAGPIDLDAHSIAITYYTISSSDPDANQLCCGTYANEVQIALGTNGLPVLNTAAHDCKTNCFSGTPPTNLLADGEITYWSPSLNNSCAGHSSCVKETGNGLLKLPLCLTDCGGGMPMNFFPPNGTGKSDGTASGYQAAILSTTLTLTRSGPLSFSIGADDMAFAFLNGQEICDLGGVHASTPGKCITSKVYDPGTYTLKVFFVDLNTTQAGLYFDVTSRNVIVSATPPSTLAVSIASAPAASAARGSVALLLDASGSMLQSIKGKTKIDIARNELDHLVRDILPDGTPMALRVYGQGGSGSCRSDLMMPLAPLDRTAAEAIVAKVKSTNGARTATAASLHAVASDLAEAKGAKRVVLVTDGEENCGGNVESEIAVLKKSGFGVELDIVGFAIDAPKTGRTFAHWAQLGGGQYFEATDGASLDTAMRAAVKQQFEALDPSGKVVASGDIGAAPINIPPGHYTVRLRGTPADAVAVDIKAGAAAAAVLPR